MSLSTLITGFIPATDPDYKKHSAVLIACADAGIKKLPEETAAYFGADYPDIHMLEEKLVVDIPVEKSSERDGCDDYIVYINQLPVGVEKIRFTNSF